VEIPGNDGEAQAFIAGMSPGERMAGFLRGLAELAAKWHMPEVRRQALQALKMPCPHSMIDVIAPEDMRGFCTHCGAVADVGSTSGGDS